MSNVPALSTGAMEQIMCGADVDKPIFQILGAKKISGTEGSDRIRMLVSDGKCLNSFAMLATQLNDMYETGKLADNTIIQLDRYITSMVNKQQKAEKRVLVILDLTVLAAGALVGHKIGNPQNWSEVLKATAASAAPASNSNAVTSTSTRPITNGNSVTSPSSKLFGANTSMLASSQPLVNATSCIAQLNPYTNKWVIKVRVMAKGQMRSWKNAKGEGTLFSVDLVDETGEIRLTAFRDLAERYYPIFEVDKVYLISKCQLKPANKQFSALNNDYEMTINNDTVIQLCDDDESSIPKVQYNFVPICQIATVEPKAAIDVIGVCTEVGDVLTFMGKTNNKEYVKREITLVDSSNASINVVLWGDEGQNFEGSGNPVIAVKGARVNEFGGGKTINSGSSLKVNPDIPEGHRLRGWFDNGGAANSNIASISARNANAGSFSTEWMSFREAQDKNIGAGDQPGYFQIKAFIHLLRDKNLVYRACPNCSKKVIGEDFQFNCEKCQQQFQEFKYRLRADILIGDWTTNRWVTCFNEVLETLLGKPASELGPILEQEDDSNNKELILNSLSFKTFIFKMRAKNELYNDVSRTKYTVMNVTAVNHKEYNQILIKDLNKMLGVN